MEMAYLGLFQKIFDWVLNKIFDPVFKWLSSLLTTVFSWLFDEILSPILLKVLESTLSWAFKTIVEIFSAFIYGVFSKLLKLIDYMEIAFDVLIGIRKVSYTTGVGEEAKTVTGSLLSVLLQEDTVNTIFWLLTVSGLALAMIFTIYSTIKSTLDFDFENKRPVSKVLEAMMKTFVQFFTMPLFTYFFLELSSRILTAVTALFTNSTEFTEAAFQMKAGGNVVSTTLGRIIFVMSSLNAVRIKKDKINVNLSNTNIDFSLGTDPKDWARYPIFTMQEDYGSVKAINENFDLAKFDYLIGFLAAVFLFFVLGICLLTFVQRIYEIILLYLVSPYFVSTIPLDDGEKFSKWREMYIAKFFTGFGSAIGMRLYLMICPLIMGGSIQFFEESSRELNYMVRLFFLVGGAWAVYKAGPMLTQLLSFQASQSEAMTQAFAGNVLHSQTVGRVSSFYQKRKDAKRNEKNQKDENNQNNENERGNNRGRSQDGRYKGSRQQAFNNSGAATGAAAAASLSNAGGNGGGGGGEAAGGGKWAALANMFASKRSQSGQSGASRQKSSRDLRGNGMQKNSMRDSQNRSPRSPLQRAFHTPNQYNRSNQQRNVQTQNTTIQKKIIVTEHRTIRSEIVNVKRNGEGGTPMYSKYSQMARAASNPGTGGYRA